MRMRKRKRKRKTRKGKRTAAASPLLRFRATDQSDVVVAPRPRSLSAVFVRLLSSRLVFIHHRNATAVYSSS
jgi:hypothetical protein